MPLIEVYERGHTGCRCVYIGSIATTKGTPPAALCKDCQPVNFFTLSLPIASSQDEDKQLLSRHFMPP